MITKATYDSVVIGAGAAGMAAATEIAAAGYRVAIIDREEHLGGILPQCIHNGFGLHHFKEELTGPEYAESCIDILQKVPIDIFVETTVVDIQVTSNTSRTVIAYSPKHGVLEFHTESVVLAMGCRERNRGNLGIPGTRPSGVLTAGLAQRLLNIDGYLPGKRVVVIGSGDIGLIMARRLKWVGVQVLAVIEILPYPSGLTRNIVQCLEDFSIPLYLSHSVTRINGHDRVESVEVAPLESGVPNAAKSFTLDCDTVLLSVGLIPENELSRKAGVQISCNTAGPLVDHRLQTSIAGIFACGNVLHVHDLVDYVSEEAAQCGKNVVAFLQKSESAAKTGVPVLAGANVKYVIPNQCLASEPMRFLMRSLIIRDRAELVVRQGGTVLHRRILNHVRPAEMVSVPIARAAMDGIGLGLPVEFSIHIDK